MALHPHFPTSPYAELLPEQRWFPAAEGEVILKRSKRSVGLLD